MELNAYIIQVGAYLIVNRRIFMLKYEISPCHLGQIVKFEHWECYLKTNKQTNNISYWYFLYIAWALGVQGFSSEFSER